MERYKKTISIEKSGKIIEISIPLTAIGILTGDVSVKIGANAGDNNSLPQRVNTDPSKMLVASTTKYPVIKIDSSFDDWNSVPDLYSYISDNIEYKMKAFIEGNYLFVYVKAPNDGYRNILIDSDNNSNTGYLNDMDNFGGDYKVESSELYSYNNPSDRSIFDQQWTVINSSVSTKNVSAQKTFEAKIPLSELKNYVNKSKMKVSFRSKPTIFPYDTRIVKEIVPYPALSTFKINLDGNLSEWQEIKNYAAHTESPTSTFICTKDDKKLYIKLQGNNMNANNVIKIYSSSSATTPSYIINRGSLYQTSVSTTNYKGSVSVSLNYTDIVYEVNLSQIDLLANIYLTVKINEGNVSSLQLVVSSISRTRDSNTIYPSESYEVLNNPYMGFVGMAGDGQYKALSDPSTDNSYNYPHSLVYLRVKWSDLQPNNSKDYDWSVIDNVARADKKIVIRIVLDNPSDEAHMDIPQWLYNKIGGANGGKTYDDGIRHRGFSPNYENTVLIEEHRKLIEAIGKQYNSDSNIVYIQAGSIGHYGEWHTTYINAEAMPSRKTCEIYMKHYEDNFKNKMVGMRQAFPLVKEKGLGIFNDGIGTGGNKNLINWINRGDPFIPNDSSKYVVPVPDFWKTNYSGGEFANTHAPNGDFKNVVSDTYFAETLNQVRLCHTTFAGPCSSLEIPRANMIQGMQYRENTEILHKTMGYRFVLESISNVNNFEQGKISEINMQWNNKGVAPLYQKHFIQLSLENSQGQIKFTKNFDADVSSFLPGITNISQDVLIPADLSPGQYKLLISINDKETKTPDIKLAIGGQRSDNIYEVGQVSVSANINISDGVYTLQNVNSNLYLDALDYGTNNGTTVQQSSYINKANQKFIIKYNKDGYYTFAPLYSPNMYFAVFNNAEAKLSTDGITDLSLWKIYKNSDGSLSISPKSNLNKCAVVQYSSTSAGANIILSDNNGSSNGFWRLNKLDISLTPMATLQNGSIVQNLNSGLNLSYNSNYEPLMQGNNSPIYRILGYSFENSNKQFYVFAAGGCLTVFPDGKTVLITQIAYPDDSAWFVCSDGRIYSKRYPSKVLAVENDSKQAGAKLILVEVGTTNSEKWNFIK